MTKDQKIIYITPMVFAGCVILRYAFLRYAFLPNIFGAEDSRWSACCRSKVDVSGLTIRKPQRFDKRVHAAKSVLHQGQWRREYCPDRVEPASPPAKRR
jgi:hypothetical protein